MTKTKLNTTPWKEIRGKRIKPEDEPRIAEIREQMEAELRLAQRQAQPCSSRGLRAGGVQTKDHYLALLEDFDE